MSETLQALGIFDAMKLLDKELVDKVLAIAKVIRVEKLENGVTRISIDLVEKP
jgi:hypothetical protein